MMEESWRKGLCFEGEEWTEPQPRSRALLQQVSLRGRIWPGTHSGRHWPWTAATGSTCLDVPHPPSYEKRSFC